MNTMMNMDPWGLLDEILGNGNRTFRTMRARAAGRFPPVNVYLDEDAVLMDLELPGKTAADIDLSLEPQAVIVAEKRRKADGEPGTPSAGAPVWSRRLELPFRIDADKANARFQDGILRIELPKAESAGVKKIAIQ